MGPDASEGEICVRRGELTAVPSIRASGPLRYRFPEFHSGGHFGVADGNNPTLVHEIANGSDPEIATFAFLTRSSFADETSAPFPQEEVRSPIDTVLAHVVTDRVAGTRRQRAIQ